MNTLNQFIRGLFSHDLLIELSEKKIVIRMMGKAGKEFVLEYEPYLAIETIGKKSIVKCIGTEAKLQSGRYIEVVNPFCHSRSFVADFNVAEKLLQHGLYQLLKSKFFKPAPRIIMHQLEKTEGGLTNIEERVLRELALGCGARDVVIYVGAKLDSENETFDEVKRKIST